MNYFKRYLFQLGRNKSKFMITFGIPKPFTLHTWCIKKLNVPDKKYYIKSVNKMKGRNIYNLLTFKSYDTKRESDLILRINVKQNLTHFPYLNTLTSNSNLERFYANQKIQTVVSTLVTYVNHINQQEGTDNFNVVSRN